MKALVGTFNQVKALVGAFSVIVKSSFQALLQVLKYVDMVSLVFFTAEFLLRLVFSPNKRHFIRDPLNFVDFISIAPFYLALLLEEFQDLQIIGKAGKQFRFLRFMRILRIFKMVRHFVGLQSLIYTIYQAYKVDNI